MQDMLGYELAKELLKRGIHTTGTIQANRKGLPVELGKNIYIFRVGKLSTTKINGGVKVKQFYYV